MPCRPRLCQRFAAQLSNTPPALPGNNHIWISDELLAEAFNRYVRVLHTTKRHGSNVPGPLEARKRATKRRMGMAVAGAATAPPGGDFGALFGAGAGQPLIQNSWSWTPPGTRSDPPAPSKNPLNIWSWGAKSPKQQPAEYEKLLEQPRTGKDLVEASRDAFDALLKDREELEMLHQTDVAGICDFLRCSADEPAARNITRLFEWLPGRSVSPSAWQYITTLICDKLQLDSIRHNELIQVVKTLPGAFDWQLDEGASQQLRDIYVAFAASLPQDPRVILPHQAVFEEICKITRSAQACSDLVDRLNMIVKLTKSASKSSENISSTLIAILKYGGEDEPRAELLSRLASVLDETPTEVDTKVHQAIFEEFRTITQSAQACSVLVNRLIKLSKITTCCDTASKNISSTLLAISRYGGEDEPRAELLSWLASALDEVPTEMVTEVLGLSTKFIVDKCRHLGFARVHVLNWLKCLSACQSFGRSPLDMKIVYAELAKILRPSQIAEHFAPPEMPPSDTIRLLLHTWLPNMDLKKLQDDHYERRSAASGRKELKTLQFGLRDLSVADLPAVADEFEQLQAARDGKSQFAPWKNFLRAFARTGIEYEAVSHEVFDICKVKYPIARSFWHFVTMLNNHELVLPTSAAVSLIKHFLAGKRPDYAFALFRNVPSVAITEVPELPAAYLEHSASTRGVFEILLRQSATVPMEWREVHKLDVTPKHLEVVHLVAYDIANAAVLRPSQAYRNVWGCYRWLQDRGAPLKPLISRALVTAGIVRPLQELLWIPEQRLDYILSIVEKVEGPEDRDQVEMLARRMRDARHQGVLSKRRAKRENFWWLRKTRMQAEETRYRVKKWTKEQPLPNADGTSYYVPMQEADPFSSQASSSSTRDGDVVREGWVDPFSQGESTEGVSTSEEANELERWWRPSGEKELESTWRHPPYGEQQEPVDIAVATGRSFQDLSGSLDTLSPLPPSLEEEEGAEAVVRVLYVDHSSPQKKQPTKGVSVSPQEAAAKADRLQDISLLLDSSPSGPPSPSEGKAGGEDLVVTTTTARPQDASLPPDSSPILPPPNEGAGREDDLITTTAAPRPSEEVGAEDDAVRAIYRPVLTPRGRARSGRHDYI
jgi:hypothetical protein